MKMSNYRKVLVALVSMVLLVSGCSGVVEEKKMEDSELYIKAPVQDVVDEWMTARNGTIRAGGGGEAFYYDENETSAVDPTSTDMRYDLPGEHCFLTEEDTESAYAVLNVGTKVIDSPDVDINAEIEKVAEFWKSQGWTDIRQGAQGQGERSITVSTPLGTQLTYTISNYYGPVMRVLHMKSLCAKEFANNSPDYLGDFNERFSNPPNTTPSTAPSKGN